MLGNNTFTFADGQAGCVWRNRLEEDGRRVRITLEIQDGETGEAFREEFCEYTYELAEIRAALERHGFTSSRSATARPSGLWPQTASGIFSVRSRTIHSWREKTMAELIRGLSDNGGIVFCGIDSTDIVCKAEQLHKTSATCSAALGRLLTGAALMGSMLKDDRDSITLRVNGGGPAGLLIACTDGTGNVKGCIDHPLVELPPRADGHLDVGGAVGKDGVLTVIRDNRLQKEPTVGQVPLVSGRSRRT